MSDFSEMIKAQLDAIQQATQNGYKAGYQAGHTAGLAEAQKILDRVMQAATKPNQQVTS